MYIYVYIYIYIVTRATIRSASMILGRIRTQAEAVIDVINIMLV